MEENAGRVGNVHWPIFCLACNFSFILPPPQNPFLFVCWLSLIHELDALAQILGKHFRKFPRYMHEEVYTNDCNQNGFFERNPL